MAFPALNYITRIYLAIVIFVYSKCHLGENLFNFLNAKLTMWPNTLKQFVGNLPTNCLSVFGHFVGLALKGLIDSQNILTVVTFWSIIGICAVFITHIYVA